jgi:TATA-box binding protein (TBP) (component of TFIID and TFIIIB)
MALLKEPSLSTMTVLYRLPMKMNTDAVFGSLPLAHPIIKIEKRGLGKRGESKRDRVRRRQPVSQTTTGFGHNSVTLVLMNTGFGNHPEKEVTIKIFHNGVFHLTGIRDEDYARSSMREIRTILNSLPDECFIERPSLTDEPVERIVLMNFTTAFLDTAKISRLQIQSFFESKGVQVNFEPDVDPAVKLQFPERWVARIFRTGKINLTAITTREDCRRFVERLESYLRDFHATVSGVGENHHGSPRHENT